MNMERYNQGLVSVVIPTCNRGELFYKAIESVLNQTYKNIEIIVIDDNSDNPLQLEQYESHPVNIIYHKNGENLGGAISRNKGASLGRGEFVCFLDDDDTYLPHKLERLVSELDADKSLDAIFGRVIRASNPQRQTDLSFTDKNGIISSLKSISYLHTNTSLIRHESFDRIKFDEELGKFQDTQLHIELVNKCKCKYIDENVATWLDNHGNGQITDMKDINQYYRSIDNFSKLKENLRRRNSISYFEYKKMAFDLSKMKVKCCLKFYNNNVELNLFEKNVLSVVRFRRSLFCR